MASRGAGLTKRQQLEYISFRKETPEPSNLRAYLPLMHYRSVLDGEGKLDELMNDRYPSIRSTTVREYVVKERL